MSCAYINTIKYYSAIEKNELAGQKTTWRHLKCTLLTERSRSEKVTYFLSPLIWHSRKGSTVGCKWASQVALVVKKPPACAGDVRDEGFILGLGRSPGGGHGNSLQYSCLQNPMDRGAWWATVYRIKESDRTETTWQAHMDSKFSSKQASPQK